MTTQPKIKTGSRNPGRRSLAEPIQGNPAFAMARHRLHPPSSTSFPSRLVVRFEPGAIHASGGTASGRGARSTSGASLPDAISGPLEWLAANHGLRSVQPLFAGTPSELPRVAMGGRSGKSARANAAISSVLDSSSEFLAGFSTLQIDPKSVDRHLLKTLRQAKGVSIADWAPVRWLNANRRTAVDPKQNSQWALRAIGWYEQKLPDAKAITVAILDSGIDEDHPDLRGRIAEYDPGRFSRTDLLGHGTHVAGIIGARANNAIGIAGIAECRLRVWKIFDDVADARGDLYVDDQAYLRALGRAAASDARVLNLSIGGFDVNQAEQALLQILSDRGKVVVAAMGNEYEEGNPKEYPAGYKGVVAVGATTVTMRRASFSNTGAHIALCAPGKNILSTLPMARSAFRSADDVEYAFWDGTSMATPCVVGSLALAFAKVPGLSGSDLIRLLPKSTRKLPAMKGRAFSSAFGYGQINLPALLRSIRP